MGRSAVSCCLAALSVALLASTALAQPGFDAVYALASQPGAVSAFSSAGSGQPGMVSSSSSGSGGSVMTSTTVNGVTQTTSSSGSNGASSSSTQVCDGSFCCSASTKLQKSGSYSHATATINNGFSRCCIVLKDSANKKPALFCAGSPTKDYYGLPSDADIKIQPGCKQGRQHGSLTCSVTLNTIPKGFYIPGEYTSSKALVYKASSTFKPCQSTQYQRFAMVVSKSNGKTLVSKCD